MRDIVGCKDSQGESRMFGGKVVLLGGDFRQVLPIVAKGTRQDIVRAALNRSYIWKECKVFVLRESMRVRNLDTATDRNKKFNEWLIAMGEGRLETKAEDREDETTWVKIPDEFVFNKRTFNIKASVDEIYPDFEKKRLDSLYLRERAILTPLNETANTVNV
ncbi:uncharacterized protein LOC141617846 [Silene latifolia]|uniref:uncharacterized protein LOC141617846 n=1 Tax=Silene latifolia TaxID=37657 RepID=UPI003D77715F